VDPAPVTTLQPARYMNIQSTPQVGKHIPDTFQLEIARYGYSALEMHIIALPEIRALCFCIDVLPSFLLATYSWPNTESLWQITRKIY